MPHRSRLLLVKNASLWFGKGIHEKDRPWGSSEEEAGLELLSEKGLLHVQDQFQQILSNGRCTHLNATKPAQHTQLDWYVTYLDAKLNKIGPALKSALHDDISINAEVGIATTIKFYQVLSYVATQLTSTEVLPTLLELRDGVLPLYFHDCHDNDAVLQILFIAIGLLTMLYDPELEPIQNTIQIMKPKHISGAPVATEAITRYTYYSSDVLDLQIHQLLNSFGRLIPGSPAWAMEILSPFEPDLFTEQVVVSYLNFHTLSKVAKIQIVFVDSLSLHLEFDEKTKLLKVFRFPSYCGLICSGGSSRNSKCNNPSPTYLSRLYGDYFAGQIYEADQRPRDTLYAKDLARETLLSYRLLFNQGPKSRKAFKAYYSKYTRAAKLTNLDPLMADLSNKDCCQFLYECVNASEAAQQYSAKREFPLLGQRLIILQKFVLSQNPSDWDGLRHDRRDILRYYTFWAVVWVGGASVVLGLVQCILGLIQIYYSAR